jgi:predicted ATPase
VIERRVERLGAATLEVLTQAAVIGRVFDLEPLESILEIDESRLLDQLEAAVAASLLAESSERTRHFSGGRTPRTASSRASGGARPCAGSA